MNRKRRRSGQKRLVEAELAPSAAFAVRNTDFSSDRTTDISPTPSIRELLSESVFGAIFLAAGAVTIGGGVLYGGYLVLLTGLSSASAGPTLASASNPWMGPVFVLLAGFVFVGLSTLFF